MHWRLFFIALSYVLSTISVFAQSWPTKPVRIIVPLSPGGSVDIIARMLASHLTERLGQQFVVDNRPKLKPVLLVCKYFYLFLCTNR